MSILGVAILVWVFGKVTVMIIKAIGEAGGW